MFLDNTGTEFKHYRHLRNEYRVVVVRNEPPVISLAADGSALPGLRGVGM
jgi:hypothetical protein